MMKDFAMEKRKKGELTTKQLVTIIILILSFSVILFLVFRLDLGQTTDKEICRNSVILLDKSKVNPGGLDCRTNYLCIGNNCEDFSGTSKIDASTKEEVFNALAEEMSDCWWMFGEGEIQYNKEGIGGIRSEASGSVDCSICSIISFGDLQNLDLSYREFYNYLASTKKLESQSQTYLEYLYGVENVENVDFQDQIVKSDILEESISLDKRYAILTGIDSNFVAGDEFLKTYLIPQEKISETQCDRFLTKA